MITLGILGAKGRMGRLVQDLAESRFADRIKISAAIDREDAKESLFHCDVVIDFSLPKAMLEVIAAARRTKGKLPAFVIGSTGWKKEELAELDKLAERTPVLMASNFSLGVQALLQLLKTATPMLERLGYKPSIIETHHQHKKDAPSGTALTIQHVISPGAPGNIPTESIRRGEVVGEHEVTFSGPGDRITIGHFAQDRSIFAHGAIESALWLAQRRAQGMTSSGIIPAEVFFQEKLLPKA